MSNLVHILAIFSIFVVFAALLSKLALPNSKIYSKDIL